jgi:two-component system sensor histidine kinase AlgZ
MNKTNSAALPDFRNLGVILRSLLLAEGAALMVSLANEGGVNQTLRVFTAGGLLREPILLALIALLAMASPILGGLTYRKGVTVVLAMAFTIGLCGHYIYMSLMLADTGGGPLRTGILAMATAGFILAYFNWRHRALSPALAEARLIALQARIRPHFLFNSLNAVLGLIRDDPRQAEMVLENLSDLYRALMAESGSLVPLAKELELARAYGEIEVIRLGERLRIEWCCDEAAMDALVPPLILQPLVENAVYHGVEPAPKGGTVSVNVSRKANEVILIVRNTCTQTDEIARDGNRMALNNIRERLDLHFDAEARMSVYRTDDEYVVRMTLPYKTSSTA